MSGLSTLKAYISDNDDSNSSEELEDKGSSEIKTNEGNFKSLISKFEVNSAPLVLYSKEKDEHGFIDDNVKELDFNPRYEDLFAPKFGPENPNLTNQQKALKNTLTGYVESTNINDFQFENQRRTFMAYGYAQDPSTNSVIGNVAEAEEKNNATAFEKVKSQPIEKRKRVKNNDPTDVEGYLGPWANYENQVMTAQPNEEERKEIAEILAKRKRRARVTELEEEQSRSILHIKDPYDYLGRSFLHIPQDVETNLRSETPPEKCFIPKKCIFEYTGHTKGVQKIQLFPVSGHLFLTCSLDCKVKLWEFYKERRCIRTYMGHAQGVRDIAFNNDGTEFLSASYDRFIKLWDVETGAMKSKFTSKKVPYCVVFNPDADKQNLFVAGMSDKKMICWDTRSGEIVQEYDRHLGAVDTITFVDNNKRIVTTSDDKSVRAWEWDIPVDFKYIADPTMHSMPSVRLSRNGKYLAFQSMDNQIKIMEPLANFRWKSKKVFRGHMVAGYACGIDYSPDMSYLISGDADGRLIIWDWKTTRLFERIKAHNKVCMDVKWHPHETSKILTCGWDNLIKLWD